MKKIVKYSKVESVTYEFSAYDVKKALISHFKIPDTSNTTISIFEEYEKKPAWVELVVRYITEDKQGKPE